MLEFRLLPEISSYKGWKEFSESAEINGGDLIITNRFLAERFRFSDYGCHVVFQEEYGKGEPSDEMIDALAAAVSAFDYKRVVGVGGGTVLDIAKLAALEGFSPSADLFQRKIPLKRSKRLILVPTTCGTGSEVTNISIAKILSLHTKLGLADDLLYADRAVLIPELLCGLPDYVFAASSIDALIHSIESYLSPKATAFTEAFSEKAISMIIRGYKCGDRTSAEYYGDFLTASCFAGISFGIAGCGAVHAMSYPLGAERGIAHGESNYAVLMSVLMKYDEEAPEGKLQKLKEILAQSLQCAPKDAFAALEKLLDTLLRHKKISEYGVDETALEKFAANVAENQKRLLSNSYIPLSEEQLLDIYRKTY